MFKASLIRAGVVVLRVEAVDVAGLLDEIGSIADSGFDFDVARFDTEEK